MWLHIIHFVFASSRAGSSLNTHKLDDAFAQTNPVEKSQNAMQSNILMHYAICEYQVEYCISLVHSFTPPSTSPIPPIDIYIYICCTENSKREHTRLGCLPSSHVKLVSKVYVWFRCDICLYYKRKLYILYTYTLPYSVNKCVKCIRAVLPRHLRLYFHSIGELCVIMLMLATIHWIHITSREKENCERWLIYGIIYILAKRRRRDMTQKHTIYIYMCVCLVLVQHIYLFITAISTPGG